MTDAQPRPPSITSFKSMVWTGVGSATVGDQIGTPIANILVWAIQQAFTKPLPAEITNDLHTVILALIVGLAFSAHYQVVKPKDQA